MNSARSSLNGRMLASVGGATLALGAAWLWLGHLSVPRAEALNLNLNQIAGLRESDLAGALRATGLTPEALTAGGADDDKAVAVVAAAAAYMGNSPSAYAQNLRAAGSAAAEVDRLERLVRRGTVHEAAALAAAREAHDQAQGTLDAYLSALRTTAMSPLSQSERATLDAILPNLERPVGVEFKVVERNEADWTALRDALANEAQAGAGITSEDHAATTLLATARGDESVSSARSRLTNNLAAVNDAYQDAVATLGE